MWTGLLPKRGGNLDAIAARARALPCARVRQERRRRKTWTIHPPGSCRPATRLRAARGIHIRGRPLGGRGGAESVAVGADVSGSTRRPLQGRYARRKANGALRAASGRHRCVDVSVRRLAPLSALSSLAAGGHRQPAAGIMEGHRRERRRRERADPGTTASTPRLARSAGPDDPPRLARFRRLAGYGAGASWWSAGVKRDEWRRDEPAPAPSAADPGWPALRRDPAGSVTANSPRSVDPPSRRRHVRRGDPSGRSRCRQPLVSASNDRCATWQAVLALPMRTVDWTR